MVLLTDWPGGVTVRMLGHGEQARVVEQRVVDERETQDIKEALDNWMQF